MSPIRILLLCLLATGFSTAQAETIHVPATYPTIGSAIDAAVTGDVIQVAAGTYYEHGLAFDLESPLITIQGTRGKDGSLLTTIDAQAQGSVFQFMGNVGASMVIKDLVITGGSGTAFKDSNYGGGIFCFASGPTLTGCTITGNLASWGGGIHFDTYSFLTITDCTISNNIAGESGGGFATSEVFPGQTTMNLSLICANQPDQIDADQLD
ncbi:MAG: right-handed parallel beta-helix repeat-containing protein, partial [Phycisphaerales bacterium]|nr:right-handed parallel beta-helix repeat-containing protein [Phycisphaerales bacterium]